MFYTYILKSLKDNGLYIGYTSDIIRRFNEHNSGISKATKHRKPFIILHVDEFITRSEAVRKERYYKTGKGREFILKTFYI